MYLLGQKIRCSLTYVALVYFFVVSFVVIFFMIHFSSSDYIHLSHYIGRGYLQLCNSNDYPLFYSKKLYHSLSDYERVQMVFYKKMKMAIAVEVCHKNEWTLHKTAHTLPELQSLLKDNHVFTIVFTSSKELSSPLMRHILNMTHVLVTGIPNAYLFTGAKREQHITYQRLLNRYECSMNDIKFMPISFLMDNVQQCQDFHKYLRLNEQSKNWVLKKSQGYGGDGVTVISNTTKIKHMFDTCPSKHQYILQEYLNDMLLLNGRKFDIRALILVANSRPYMLFYHEGYLRVVMSQFNVKGTRDVHLTNTHVQSMQPNFNPDDHFWSFTKFQSYLDIHHPYNEKYVSNYLVPQIKKIAIFILKAGYHLLDPGLSSNGFQLLGLDLMITNDWHVWFIEANNYPLWPKGGWVTEFTTKMGGDMLDLVISIRQRPEYFLSMNVKKWYNSWQLIWKEKPPNCHGNYEDDAYNPCLTLQQIN